MIAASAARARSGSRSFGIRALSVSLIAAVLVLLAVGTAYGWDETGNTSGEENFSEYCYPQCHGGDFNPRGPHGSYGAGTDRCRICHELHDATGSVKLLPADTIVGTCFTCHDGTGGQGVYGAVKARTGVEPAGGHSYSTTNTIPGGDPLTGGPATGTFSEASTGYLICTDCHSPHGQNVVGPFRRERLRTDTMWFDPSNRLLRRQPTGATGTVDVYGSDWCLGCHAGRGSGGAVHNHPVETSATAAGSPYTYPSLPILASDGPTRDTVLGSLGGTYYNEFTGEATVYNRGYLMPYPRSLQQAGHGPICQQCHEDSRRVGFLSSDGLATAQSGGITTPDGSTSTDNPRFQNFPHETVNRRLLVETDDDLCINCHPPAMLP